MPRSIPLLFVVIAALLSSPVSGGSPYCEGFDEGYKAGYCYRQYSCISPITPICPIARIGESTYGDGYNRGFLAGLNAH